MKKIIFELIIIFVINIWVDNKKYTYKNIIVFININKLIDIKILKKK